MTLADPTVTTAIPAKPIDPPVLAMSFSVNKSPFAGKDGTHVVGAKIKQRLLQEIESNISLHVSLTSSEDSYEVKGRGELQLAILLENMRREGFELAVSQPRILMKKGENGEILEPIEEVTIDIEPETAGWLMEAMSKRKADVVETSQVEGRVRMKLLAPARGLLGFRAEFMNETHGSGIMSHIFHSYEKHRGSLAVVSRGALIASADGTVTTFALSTLESRGVLYIAPGDKIYAGQVIGENSRGDDLDVNACKMKQLTNVRTVMKEDAVKLSPPKILTLETALSLVRGDELVEITPKSIRIRKRELTQSVRRKNEKRERDQIED